MARNTSPFAALTNQEKQIKWMEYQTIRLPYTKVTGTEWKETHLTQQNEQTFQPPEPDHEQSNHAPVQQKQAKQEASRPIPPPEVFAVRQSNLCQSSSEMQNAKQIHSVPSTYQQLNQKTRHRQYDAVIERMKLAEKRVSNYQSWSK